MSAGAGWKERRESLGKSVEDISAELRISRKYIEGMEAGDFSGWPARVFAQGFIRSYGSLLGTDPEPLLEEYQRHHEGVEQPAAEAPSVTPLPAWSAEEKGRGRRAALYGAVALFLVAAALLVGRLADRRSEPTAPVPRTQPPAAASPAAAPPPSASSSVPSPGAAVPSPATENGAFAAVPATGPYHLLLEAVEETWVSWAADDGKASEATLAPGDRVNVPAQRRIQLRLGNAGGVVPSVNGRRVAPFGKRGQVVTVLVGPAPAPKPLAPAPAGAGSAPRTAGEGAAPSRGTPWRPPMAVPPER